MNIDETELAAQIELLLSAFGIADSGAAADGVLELLQQDGYIDREDES